MILQAQATECGLACLAMIATYFGHKVDLAYLRRRFLISLKGTTLHALMRFAERLHLGSRALRLEMDDLHRINLPCVLHWELDHFVVLKKVTGRGIEIHDPAFGERKLSWSQVSSGFTGVALEIWPQGRFERKIDQRTIRVRDLVGSITGFFSSLSQFFLLALVLELFAILSPLALQWVIDNVLVSANRDLLLTLVFAFAFLVILQQVIGVLRSWFLLQFCTAVSLQWRANTFSRLLRLPIEYFEKRHLGDITSRFRSIDVILTTVTTTFVAAVLDGIMAFVMLAIMYLYSPTLTTIGLCAIAIYFVIRWIGFRPTRLAAEEEIVSRAKQESHFFESVRGAKSVKLFRRESERQASWQSLLVAQVNASVRVAKFGMLFTFASGLLFGLQRIAIIGLGAVLVLNGEFTVGMLVAFTSYDRQFSSRVSTLIDNILQIRMLSLHRERIADILLSEPEDAEEQCRLAWPGDQHQASAVQMEAVKYRYGEGEPYILAAITLSVAPGEAVAIVGPSGSGKTTLLNLVLGILKPSEGRILVDGVDISLVDKEYLRSVIGSVTQDDILFAGSVGDNIGFFDSNPDQAWIEECARMASVHSELLAMPMAYNTLVGHMGSALSGGQKQRVLLARALYMRPKVLILDEATSHLDLAREKMVNDSLDALHITRIIVAHRPQSVENADRILALEGGQLVSKPVKAPRRSAIHSSL